MAKKPAGLAEQPKHWPGQALTISTLNYTKH